MSPNLTLAIVAGALVACGVYLITERSLMRVTVWRTCSNRSATLVKSALPTPVPWKSGCTKMSCR